MAPLLTDLGNLRALLMAGWTEQRPVKTPQEQTVRRSLSERPTQSDPDHERRIKWWREDRFGLFIHWALYAVPAGRWKGQAVPGSGEWIMIRARIPVAEYEQHARQFNPVKFNAEHWVAIASKHHDGFAMYGSKVASTTSWTPRGLALIP